MFDSFIAVFKVLNLQIIMFAALLFFIGYAFAPTAYYKKIKWLTAYPFFIIKLMDKYFKHDWPPLKIFMVIFFLNSLSLFINLLTGWGVILPILVVIYMGMNIGIVMYHSLKGNFYYLSLINPVAMIELPAAWISIAMAMQFSLTHYFNVSYIFQITFSQYVYYFIKTIIPLLIGAGIIETFLITVAKKQQDKSETEDEDKNN